MFKVTQMKNKIFCRIAFLILLWIIPLYTKAGVLTLPQSIAFIHNDAFAGNLRLTDIVISGTPDIEMGAFNECTGINAVHILSGEEEVLKSLLSEIESIQYVSAPGGSTAYATALNTETVMDVRRSDRKPRALILYQSYKNVDSLKTLTGPTNDATAIYRLLKLWGTDVRKNGGWTASEMLSQIRLMGDTSEEGDITFIFFSGHGKANGSLLGADGEEMTLNEFTDAVSTIKGRRIIIVDACYSGRLIDDGEENYASNSAKSLSKNNALESQKVTSGYLSNGEEFPNIFTTSFLSAFRTPSSSSGGQWRAPTQLTRDSGNYVIAAARYDQESWEAQLTVRYAGETFSKQMGFFTYYLCRGLGWDGVADFQTAALADTDDNGLISFYEAFRFVEKRLNEDPTLSDRGVIQSAQMSPEGDLQFTPFWHLPYLVQ